MADPVKRQYRLMPETYKTGGVVRLVVIAEGWVMVRRPRCIPFLVEASVWNQWPECNAHAHLLAPESDNG